MNPRPGLFLLSMLCCTATAQQTWTVGTGGQFQSVTEANDSPLVRPGDTLQIISNTVPNFTLTLGVTVRGPATITEFTAIGCQTTIGVPGGQRARLVDLQFVANCYGQYGSDGALNLSGGQVILERCSGSSMRTTVTGADCAFLQCTLINGGLRVESGTVTLHRCTFLGRVAAAGLTLLGGAVAAVSSSFYGGPHWCFGHGGCKAPAPSGPGIWVGGGSLHGADLQCLGGTNSGYAHLPSGAGVYMAATTGRVWLADSRLTGGGHSFATGGAGLENLSGVPARLARCTLMGGAGTLQGPPSIGPVDANAPLFGVRTLQADLSIGAPYQIRFLGPPGHPLILLMSATLQRLDTPLVEQPLRVFADPAWVNLAAGVFDLTGALGFDLVVPNDPALVNQPFWFHGIGGAVTPLQAAPPVGGYVQ